MSSCARHTVKFGCRKEQPNEFERGQSFSGGWKLTVGLMLSMGRAAETALTKAAPPATPGKSFWTGAPSCNKGAVSGQLPTIPRWLPARTCGNAHVAVVSTPRPTSEPPNNKSRIWAKCLVGV